MGTRVRVYLRDTVTGGESVGVDGIYTAFTPPSIFYGPSHSIRLLNCEHAGKVVEVTGGSRPWIDHRGTVITRSQWWAETLASEFTGALFWSCFRQAALGGCQNPDSIPVNVAIEMPVRMLVECIDDTDDGRKLGPGVTFLMCQTLYMLIAAASR